MAPARYLLGIFDPLASALADALKGSVDFVVGSLLKLVGAALLGLVKQFMAPLLLYTPAVVPDSSFVLQNGFIDRSSYITATIHEFVQRSLWLSGSLIALGIAVSALLMTTGFWPTLADAARDNLRRLILLAPAALLAPYLLQFVINVDALLYAVPCPHGPSTCLDMDWGLVFQVDASAFASGDMVNAAIGMAMIVTALALLFGLLYLAARFAVIILIASVSPLLFAALAFHFSRPLASKALAAFTSSVFYQFFALVLLKVGLTLMQAAAQEPSSLIPAWMVLLGCGVALTYLPKTLSAAGAALGGAARFQRLVGAAGAAALGGSALVARPIAAGAGRLAEGAAGRAAAGGRFAHAAAFHKAAKLSNRVHERSRDATRAAGNQVAEVMRSEWGWARARFRPLREPRGGATPPPPAPYAYPRRLPWRSRPADPPKKE
ncbi:MAG: hypothetical protein ACYDBQ_10660 [Thermoplasmatota archaeon]